MYAETWDPAPDQARIKYSIEESYTGQYATMIRKFDTIDNSSDWYVDIDVNKCIFLDPLFYCISRNDENNKKNSLWEVILLSFFKMSPELFNIENIILTEYIS